MNCSEQTEQYLAEVSNKLTSLEKTVSDGNVVVRAHPVVFIILVILFFVTMDFWGMTVHSMLKRFYPARNLAWYEYLFISVVLLFVILLTGKHTGIKIRMLGA